MMYIICVFLLGVFVFALLWYPLAIACNIAAERSWELMAEFVDLAGYTNYISVFNFMTNFWRALPALALIAFLIWAIIYAQRKAGEMA